MITLEPDARVDTYRLIRPLGKGGFAEVWEAQSETDGRRVALKVLTEVRAGSERALERFEQEGRLAASLSSPRCVYVFGAGAWEGFPYIAMELMSGGTLAGRIESGPLSSREAVDCILDVLDGLEAAQRQGILHRDVKPSNVFLGADGRAKIGDFGISKSLEVDSKLSQTGAFLGTPYYASPEQIAAEPLDLRSDLYSVGAMLYEVLTGKLPYMGTNASQVLAQVLTREPVPFAQTGVAVPDGLQRVAMRLLAKQKEKRYQTYNEARDALVPFSSRGLEPAPLPRRFGAIVIDFLLFFPVSFVTGALLVQRNFRGQLGVTLLIHLAQLTYFTLTERYGAASLGKRLLGLRVTTTDGAGAGLAAIAGRTLTFLLLYAGPGLVVQRLAAHGVGIGTGFLSTWLPAFAEVLGFALILGPMRRRNGFAGIHEILSGTRVMALAGRERPATVVPSQPLPEATRAAAGGHFGPYRATAEAWTRDGESLSLARDEALGRDVWVHAVRSGALPLDVVRDRGAGSLTWLQRGTSPGTTWDAYGAPGGVSFPATAAGRGLGWREMRVVLHTLAVELRDRFARHGTAGVLSPEYVWVDPQGRGLLLDFPARPEAGPAAPVTPETWQAFLTDVTARGLRDSGTGRRWPSAPLPEHARTVLALLAAKTGSLDEFVAGLEGASGRPARVTSWKRLGPLGIVALVPALVVTLRLILPVFLAGLPPWYRDLTLNAQPLIDSLRSADARAAQDTIARHTAAAIRVILARDRLDAGLAPQIGKPALANLPPRALAELDSAAAQYPSPDRASVAEARAWVAGRVPQPEFRAGLADVPPALVTGMKTLGILGAVGALLALALRGGLLFTLFGIAIQRSDGAPAGRLRCFARALLAWSPVMALIFVSQVSNLKVGVANPGLAVSATDSPPGAPPKRASALDDALIVMALAGAAFAVVRPARGLAERVAGVVLVPK